MTDFTVHGGDLFAFYGILMDSWIVEMTAPDAEPDPYYTGQFERDCVIPGRIWAVRDSFPALLLSEGDEQSNGVWPSGVRGRLWRVPMDDDSREICVESLDVTEGFVEHDLQMSMYVRRRVRLTDPSVTAWVYEWNYSISDLRPIPSGDWRMEREAIARRQAEFWGGRHG